jgi:hypothetical protein
MEAAMECGNKLPLLIDEIHFLIAHPDVKVFPTSPAMDRLRWPAGKGIGMDLTIGWNQDAVSITASRRR